MVRLRISRRNQRVAKIAIPAAAVVMVFALVLTNPFMAKAASVHKKYKAMDTNYPVPTTNVAWISPDGNDNSGNGTEARPFATFRRGLQAVSDGGTVVAKSGVYREPHFFVTKKNITFQAAPHAEVWMKGSDVVSAGQWTKEGNMWKTTGKFRNFCRVCTVNPDPSKEGMAAYPEQMFIDDEPLEQVDAKSKVGPGKFYVEDKNPTTLKDPTNNRAGFNVGTEDDLTYYVGSDPSRGTTEITNRARAFSVGGRNADDGSNFTMKAINVAQYSPVQSWSWDRQLPDDQVGTSMIVVNGRGSVVQDSIFTQSSSVGFNTDAEGARIVNNKFIGNGGNGAGANRAHNTTFENNIFTENNAANYLTNGSVCLAWCTVSEIKVTHIENFTFRGNVVDNSKNPASTGNDYYVRNGTAGVWCDEGCIKAKIVNNFFINTTTAIFDEVSDGTIIASNIIEGSGAGIGVSSSSNSKVYNNTISRTNRPIMLNEDARTDGCNERDRNNPQICKSLESWSAGKGLSWNLTGLEMYNNIISSRAVISGDTGAPLWSYPVRSTGGPNHTGPGTYTNDMFKGFDYNAYYRSSLQNEGTIMTWDLADVPNRLDILFANVKDIAKDSRVRSSIDGRDTHSFDLFGTRANNPYFIKEAEQNTDYRKSNYNLKAGSPAIGSGKPLSAEVASAIDPSGQQVKPGVAVNRGALVNAYMDSTNSPTPPQPPAAQGVNIPDARLRQLLNKRLAEISGKTRSDTQAITAQEMLTIDRMYVDNTGNITEDQRIKDLTGLEYAKNATELSLGNHAITNLQPLAGLIKLRALQLSGNKVADIQPLAGLSELRSVNLSENVAANYGPLSSLNKLEQVSMSGTNQTLDLSIFSGSKNSLKKISFYDYGRKTKVVNAQSLVGAPALTSLRLTGGQLSEDEIAAIGRMTQLTELRLDYSTIMNAQPLAGLNHLTSLKLENQQGSMTTESEVFNSPLKDASGAPVTIENTATLVNEAAGKLKVAAPVYDGQPHALQANWSKQITVNGKPFAFSGTLHVTATLPKPDLSALRTAIANAEKEPAYITNDATVKQALAKAKEVEKQPNPAATAIQKAANDLNTAVANAKKKEADAQTAAEQAVAQAEHNQDPDDVTSANAKVAAVQDPTKKQAFQDRLNQVTANVTAARTALSALITKAKDPATTAGMSQETKDAVAAQATQAEQVAANAGASVAELNAAKAALQAKLDALRPDLSALRTAIANAEKEPAYITNDATVKQALAKAKEVEKQPNPAATAIQKAANDLNTAVANAKKKEADAQTAAEQAVAQAEHGKTQAAVNDARALVAKVQDATKRTALENRLNAIVISGPQAPRNKMTVAQPHHRSLTVETSGNSCYNLATAQMASTPDRYNNRVLREGVDFTINCHNQTPAVGFTARVTLTLSRRYANTNRLTIGKIINGRVYQDITSRVTFGNTPDGKYTTITYDLTDGGFGDSDGAANGTIIDPVGIYEEEDATQNGNQNANSGSNSAVAKIAKKASSALADTGSNAIMIALGSVAVVATGAWIIIKRRR